MSTYPILTGLFSYFMLKVSFHLISSSSARAVLFLVVTVSGFLVACCLFLSIYLESDEREV
ncbi:hypothetical protein QBC45DRAFT_404696 [Copromyces sp. CBS 386.78]|nr:hypothetical protein QBC45DRAFT_404696 [Copromyces sp. CBS 386.78]